MARKETILDVFVASPSDVAEERKILSEVVDELNRTWSAEYLLRLNLVAYETHAAPSFGEDPQDVINRQIQPMWDVFVGIMWTRFGTPTIRAESGTEEEFQRAYDRYKADPSSIEVMFYFKTEPISPERIDPEQLCKVLKFKRRLKELGGLTWDFSSIDAFRNVLRTHLSRALQNWAKKTGNESAALSDEPGGMGTSPVYAHVKRPEFVDEEDLGLFDLVEIIEDSTQKGTGLLRRIAEATQILNDAFRKRTEEANAVTKIPGSTDLKTVKRIANRLAEDLEDYASRINIDIPILKNSFSSSFEALGRAASLTVASRPESAGEIKLVIDSITDLRTTLTQSLEHISSFQKQLNGFPKLTSRLNRAKRNAYEILELLLSNLRDIDSQLAETIRTLWEIKGDDNE